MGLKQDLHTSRKTLAGFAVIGLAWAAYFAQMPVLKAGLGASDGVYGLVLLCASFGALAAMWLAPLAERHVGGLALPISTLAVGAGMLWAGISAEAASLTMFGLAMLLASAGSGVLDVLVNARISEAETETGRGLMNLNHAFYSFAYAGAALLTGALRASGWDPPAIFGGLAVLIAVLAWITIGAKPAPLDLQASAAPTPSPRLIWLGGAVVFVAFLCEASSEGWSALHLERTLGGTAAEGAMGPAILGLTMGFGRLFGHLLAQSLRDTDLIRIACLAAALGLVIAGAAASVWIAYLGFALAGMGISVVAPLALALIGRVVPEAQRLVAISRVSVLGYGAFFVGPPLMGLVSEGFGLRRSFYVVAAILVFVALRVVPALARRVR